MHNTRDRRSTQVATKTSAASAYVIMGTAVKKMDYLYFFFNGCTISRAELDIIGETFNTTEYKVPLREEARGVAQERNEKHPA